jgi:hypothetical protein
MRSLLCWLSLLFVPLVLLAARPADVKKDESEITWKKTVLDRKFRAEGVAVADVNKDGKLDILTAEGWYEAPDWKFHEIQKPHDYGDGSAGYSNCFACWTEDLNKDGWPDLIVIDFPGTPCYWFENPQGKDEHWKKHIIWPSACDETPLYVDLLGTGQRVLLMSWVPMGGKDGEGQMAYFTPGKDPTALWEVHAVSVMGGPGKPVPGTHRFSHGLGAGDINGDGRLDVIIPEGWWEQPAKLDGTPWAFHRAPLGDACANMYACDLDADGKADVISSSAHNYGIWWYQQKPGTDGSPTFIKHTLFPRLLSQTHALNFVDINGDGLKDLVTGKRWWAHGPKGDANPNDPAVLYWFEARKNKDGVISFLPHQIDDNSGIGTQFVVSDVNGDGLPDIVTANKKGVFLFEQVRDRNLRGK